MCASLHVQTSGASFPRRDHPTKREVSSALDALRDTLRNEMHSEIRNETRASEEAHGRGLHGGCWRGVTQGAGQNARQILERVVENPQRVFARRLDQERGGTHRRHGDLAQRLGILRGGFTLQ
jgi:hypothetical protein